MKWFKHYHNADTSRKLCLLIESHGVAAYGHYWLLLELLCEKYKADETKILVTEGELCRKLRKPFPKKMKTFLEVFRNLSLFNYKVHEKTFEFEVGILSELKQKDFRKPQINSAPTANKPPLREKRIRDKSEEEDVLQTTSKKPQITEQDVINAWDKLNQKISNRFQLTRNQVNKLIVLNSLVTREQFFEAIDRLKLDPWFIDQDKKNQDMILIEDVITRTFQKATPQELREDFVNEN